MVLSLAKTRLPEKRCNKRQARRHSSMVHKLRIALPVIAVGIGSTYVVMATPQTVDQTFVNQFENLDVATEDMRLERPRFVGQDSDGRAFEVIADAAKQNPDTPDLVALDNPEAFKDLGGLDEEYIRALTGLYSAENKTIDLRNNVRIRQGIGNDSFELTTEVGQIALEDRTFSSDVKVFGESSKGTISAEGMTAYQDEDKVVFRGAHMRYNAQTGFEVVEDEDGDVEAGTGSDEEPSGN